MQKQTEEYLQTVLKLSGDEVGRRAAWAYMEHSNAITGKGVCPVSFLPVVYDDCERELFEKVCNQAYGLMSHIISLYKTNPAFRSFFRFDDRVRDLLEINTGCNQPLPVSRLDAIYNPDGFELKFCEFNTNASGGMAETIESLKAIKSSRSYKMFCASHDVKPAIEESLMDEFVSLFNDIYKQGSVELGLHSVKRPHVAIAVLFDTPDACVKELEAFIPYFNKYGMDCSVFDVRNLKFSDGELWGTKALAGKSNVKIDAVWNFLIVVDLLSHWNEVQDFLSALKSKKVFMAGSFITQVVHDKQLFALLYNSDFQEYLTTDEKSFVYEHIPKTYFLSDLDGSSKLEEIKTNKDCWIVKPCDWYASQKVHCGRSMDSLQWNALIDTCIIDPQNTWIVQEYIEPYKTSCIPLHGKESEFTLDPVQAGNVLGLYVYGGRFSGVYMRQGLGPVIGTAAGELCAPVVWVNG